MVTQKPYRVGSRVQVKNVSGGYPLPPGLQEGDEVVVLAMETGQRLVEKEGKEFVVPMACIDPGWRYEAIFDREQVRDRAAELARQGVFIGTSSWKYEGWLGQLYSAQRYEYRGKVATSRFEAGCLEEYADVFKTVCVDAAYYTFPRREYLERLAAQVPDDFQFGLKVTDAITVKKFPKMPRFGANAGKANPNFLNADLFATAFLKTCEVIRPKIGVIMLEFSRFWPTDYEHGKDFVADLDAFLAKVPRGWPIAIEMLNAQWLREEYFACLNRHGVTHVFNSWDAMPAVGEQMELAGSRTNPNLVASRRSWQGFEPPSCPCGVGTSSAQAPRWAENSHSGHGLQMIRDISGISGASASTKSKGE